MTFPILSPRLAVRYRAEMSFVHLEVVKQALKVLSEVLEGEEEQAQAPQSEEEEVEVEVAAVEEAPSWIWILCCSSRGT